MLHLVGCIYIHVLGQSLVPSMRAQQSMKFCFTCESEIRVTRLACGLNTSVKQIRNEFLKVHSLISYMRVLCKRNIHDF
jgi:hypothetical protein